MGMTMWPSMERRVIKEVDLRDGIYDLKGVGSRSKVWVVITFIYSSEYHGKCQFVLEYGAGIQTKTLLISGSSEAADT